MKASRFIKGNYRKHAPLTSRPTTCNALGKKEGYPEANDGKNRHERRAEKRRYTLATKGKAGTKLLRRMFRANGLQETIMLMHGYNRGVKRHPGYPTMGNYDKTGGYLASPRGKK